MHAAGIRIRLFYCVLLGAFISQVVLAADHFDLRYAAFMSAERQLGGLRGSYFVPNHLVSEQLSMGLSRPNPIQRLAHGANLVSGCRLHSCDEKAAIVATDDGRALAFSLIYFCRSQRSKSGHDRGACGDKPSQDIFLKRRSADAESELKAWAQKESGPMPVQVRLVR